MLEELQGGLVTLVLAGAATLMGFGIRWVKVKMALDQVAASREEEELVRRVVSEQVQAKEQSMKTAKGPEKKSAVEIAVRSQLALHARGLAKGAVERLMPGVSDKIEAAVSDMNSFKNALRG